MDEPVTASPPSRAPTEALVVVRTRYESGFRSGWHSTDRAQLIYPSRGVMTIETRSGAWVVPPLRACWLPAFEAHCVTTATGLEMHSVYCRGLLELLPDRCGIVPVSPLMRELILALAEHPLEDPALLPFDHMAAVLTRQIRLQPQTPLFLPSVRSDRLRRIAEALQADPADRRSLEDWASELATTSRTLSRGFAREVGMSFTEFRSQVRLHAALGKLAEGRSVTTVAYNLGFSSATNFISMFRRATGMTPKAYFGR